MRPVFLFALIVFVSLASVSFSQVDVQYAELVPQLISDNADPDCQTFVTYSGQGEPSVQYFIWDSKGGRENPTYSGEATCIGNSWASGKACHSRFFNPQPLTGVVYCAIEASSGEEMAGKCAISARACKACGAGCGDGKCSEGETSKTCSQDCLFYGPEVKVLAPICYTTLHRGETVALKLSARNEGAPLTGAAVSASGFFGSVSLFDGNDNAPGDGIYAANVTVPRDAFGVLPIVFTVKGKGVSEERATLVRVVSGMAVFAEIAKSQKLGDVVPVRGSASSLGRPADGEARAEFYSPSGKLIFTEKATLANGSFAFSYHSTLTDELGNWSVMVNATDGLGNSGSWAGDFALAKLAPGSFLEVEHISPVAGAYSRGSTLSVSVRVKIEGKPLSGAKVFFFSPANAPVEMSEVGSGVYGATYKIAQGDPLGAWAVVSRATATTDSGTVEGGSSYKVNVVPSTIRVEITRPVQAEFSVGDMMEVVATAEYLDGESVTATRAFAVIGGDRVHMEQSQPGAFFAYYSIPEEKQGELMLTVEIEDGAGNFGSKGATVSVRGTALLYLIDKNRFIVIPAVIAILIAIGTFCKNCLRSSKKGNLLKRKEQVIALQAKLQGQYLKEGSVDRKTYYDLSAKYDSELQKIEHELGEK
ncbi:MAG: hypothetical protein V1909_06445 [Candidatus Micrarchaeota archaeon]